MPCTVVQKGLAPSFSVTSQPLTGHKPPQNYNQERRGKVSQELTPLVVHVRPAGWKPWELQQSIEFSPPKPFSFSLAGAHQTEWFLPTDVGPSLMHLYGPHPELCVPRLASGPSNMDTRALLWVVSPWNTQSPLILWLFFFFFRHGHASSVTSAKYYCLHL